MRKKNKRDFVRRLAGASAAAEVLAAILIFFLQKASFIV